MDNQDYIELQKIVRQILSESQVAIIKSATVVSYTAPNAVVVIAGSTTNITIPNKTGISLVANDRVEVIIKNGDMSNMFIGWKI